MRRTIIAAGLLLAGISVVSAQELTADDEINMQQCIETVHTYQREGENVSMRECIGAASRICMEAPEGQTTIGMAECTMRENKWWDNYLNFLYQDLKNMLSEEQFTALRDAQRKWIDYRDAKCGFEYEFWKDGTIRSTFYTSCVLDTTASRAIDLSGYMDWFQ